MKKVTCQKHKKVVEKYDGTINELADDISNLHYETLEIFFERLSDKIFLDSMNDTKGGRHKLGTALNHASLHLKNVKTCIGQAWVISKPHMWLSKSKDE